MGGLYSYFEDLNINKNNLKVILNEINTLKKMFNSDIFFELDENLDNKLLNEISQKCNINCFLSSCSLKSRAVKPFFTTTTQQKRRLKE